MLFWSFCEVFPIFFQSFYEIFYNFFPISLKLFQKNFLKLPTLNGGMIENYKYGGMVRESPAFWFSDYFTCHFI